MATHKQGAVRANLYSVHWQSSKEGGYYHSTHRILALDALDAIAHTRPDRACGGVKLQCKSVDLLAEGIIILVSPNVLTEDYETRGYYSDADWRKVLGCTESEQFNARGDAATRGA